MARPLPLTDTPLIRRSSSRPTALQLVMARTHLLLHACRLEAMDQEDEFGEAYRAVALWLEEMSSS
jgi:hypothetical protein